MGCATSIVKYFVFIFNFLFLLAGIAFIVIGVIVKLDINNYALDDLPIPVDVAPILMIIIGCIVFVISFFGCCGAIKENTCLLTTYAIILLVILIAQIAIGVYAFIQIKDSAFTQTDVDKVLDKLIGEYQDKEVVRETVDLIQIEFKCCGISSPLDWKNKYPASCCGEKQGECSNPYPKGCGAPVFDFVKDFFKIIGIVIIVIAAVELIGAIIALCLSSSLKNNARRGHYA